MSSEEVGFIGLGRMGGPMAQRLLEAGYTVTVHDPDTEAMTRAGEHGARTAGSVAEVADHATTVLLSLPTPGAVREVAVGDAGVTAGSRAKRVIDLSTTGPQAATEIAAQLRARGVEYFDAPVSGGVAGAKKGSLTLMVACPQDVFGELESILRCFGEPCLVGERPGMGQTMKVINNLVSVTAIAVSSEALALGARSGLEPKRMLEIINKGTGRNGATMDKIPKHVLSGRYDFGFAIALSRKDTSLCLDEAERQGLPMIVGNAVRQLLTITQARYGADADMMMLTRCIEDWAGTDIRGDWPELG